MYGACATETVCRYLRTVEASICAADPDVKVGLAGDVFRGAILLSAQHGGHRAGCGGYNLAIWSLGDGMFEISDGFSVVRN